MKDKAGMYGNNVVRLQSTDDFDPARACEVLISFHDEQMALCRRLEEVADQLPEVTDTQSCLRLAKQIHAMIHEAHEYEEKTVFPHLMTSKSASESLKSTLERLRYEHWEDESFADEVSDGLIAFVNDRATANAETLAYMLRGFFEGLRRHIAFEREHILPLVMTLKTA